MSDLAITPIRVPLLLWAQLIFQLRRRSAGKRESGAFLLGRDSVSACITAYICYDDLDLHAYQSGAIAFHAAGYAALWQHCRDKSLQVLADVHTHPCESAQQSPIDRRNPMVPVVGHTAIIVPNFARSAWWSLRTAGIYEYLGDFKWRIYSSSEKSQRIRLTLW